MPDWLALYAAVAKLAVLATGLVILFYAGRAAQHSGDEGLWLLLFGLLLSGVGFVLSGLLSAVLHTDPWMDLALTSTLATVGLALVVYSMFTEVTMNLPQS
jgi:hypothetical protein